MTTKFDHKTARFLSATLRGAAKGSARKAVTRKDFTDRLGLPENCSNAEFLGAVDALVAAKAVTPTATAVSADEALYASIYGR